MRAVAAVVLIALAALTSGIWMLCVFRERTLIAYEVGSTRACLPPGAEIEFKYECRVSENNSRTTSGVGITPDGGGGGVLHCEVVELFNLNLIKVCRARVLALKLLGTSVSQVRNLRVVVEGSDGSTTTYRLRAADWVLVKTVVPGIYRVRIENTGEQAAEVTISCGVGTYEISRPYLEYGMALMNTSIIIVVLVGTYTLLLTERKELSTESA